MSRRSNVVLGWLGGSVTTAVLLMTFMASADGSIESDGVPTLVPYQGRLERDGALVDEDVDVTFRVWDGATLEWSERRTVSVVAGRFAVLLGDTSATSAAALATTMRNADALELDVVLHTTSGDVSMVGRKAFTPAPYAMLAGGGVDAQLGGQLVVEAEDVVSASGDGTFVLRDSDSKRLLVDGDDLDSNDTLALNRASKKAVHTGGRLIARGKVGFASSTQGDGGTALQYTTAGNVLTINPGGALGNSTTFDANVWFDADVTGLDATCTSDNSSGSCVTYDLGLTSGTLTQYCPDRMAIVGGIWGGLNNGGKGLQFMRCCPYTLSVK
ncbi:MAG: hypothetical protein U1F43_21205 [Myxococcota bacterium]